MNRVLTATAIVLAGCAAGAPLSPAERAALESALRTAVDAQSISAHYNSGGEEGSIRWQRGPVVMIQGTGGRRLRLGAQGWIRSGASWMASDPATWPGCLDPYEVAARLVARTGEFVPDAPGSYRLGDASVRPARGGPGRIGLGATWIEYDEFNAPAVGRYEETPAPFEPGMSPAVRKSAWVDRALADSRFPNALKAAVAGSVSEDAMSAVLAFLLLAQDPVAQTKAAVEKTRAQKSYSATFTGLIAVPGGAPFHLEGKVVWVAPGVLFLNYKGAGGEELRVVRAGEKVWLYSDQAEEWVDPEEAGKPGAGRGLNNPDEVLQALGKVAGRATSAGADKVQLKLDGKDLLDVLKRQVDPSAFIWEESSGQIEASIGADGRITKIALKSELASSNPALKGKMAVYTGNVEVKEFDKEFSMAFTQVNPVNKKETLIPIAPAVLQEIGKLPGIPEELKAEVKRLEGSK